MYTFILATAITTCLLIAALAFKEWLADRWAAYQDGAQDALSAPEALRQVPESTLFDPKPDVVRARIQPVTPRRPRAVREEIRSLEWARLLGAVEGRVPKQREASDG